jgi:hypothetical protein
MKHVAIELVTMAAAALLAGGAAHGQSAYDPGTTSAYDTPTRGMAGTQDQGYYGDYGGIYGAYQSAYGQQSPRSANRGPAGEQGLYADRFGRVGTGRYQSDRQTPGRYGAGGTRSPEYQQGYQAGYQSGYEVGYQAGYGFGYELGYGQPSARRYGGQPPAGYGRNLGDLRPVPEEHYEPMEDEQQQREPGRQAPAEDIYEYDIYDELGGDDYEYYEPAYDFGTTSKGYAGWEK